MHERWQRIWNLSVAVALVGACMLSPSAAARLIVGTPHGDTLVGTRHADTLRGRGGPDRIFGKGGNDRLFGGAGNDRLSGGPGRDRFSCGSGRDVVFAQRGEHVARDCEQVHWLGPPIHPPPPPPPPPPKAATVPTRASRVPARSATRLEPLTFRGRATSRDGVTDE